MLPEENNLLAGLHKWASSQDENFTTESFVHLLRLLVELEPDAAKSILDKLSGHQLPLDVQNLKKVSITAVVPKNWTMC